MSRSRVSLLAWVVAIAFLLGSVLTLLDQFNVFVTPPEIPETANLVERMEGIADYRQAIWPVFLWENILFAVGFVAAVAFAWSIAAASAASRALPIFTALATTGGIIAAIASIIPIGAVEGSVWQLYCDCGFKDTEIVAGLWAQQVAEGVGFWLGRGGSIILAVALVALVREGRAQVTPTLQLWTFLSAFALVLVPLLGITELTGDPTIERWVSLLTGVVLVPVWAVWLARSVERSAGAPEGVSA
jgi:hypothetical protein